MYVYSIIIPHFNIHQLLKRLLSTIPQREDLQVIVVDDCSTKDIEILEELRKKYHWVEWYSTGINGGGGKARNIGLEHAKGKYLIFADSDDFFLPPFGDALEEYKNRDFDICYFPAISLDTDTFYPASRGLKLRDKINESFSKLDASILKFTSTVPWGKIIRREIVEDKKIKFQESIISNDVFFSTQVDLYVEKCITDKRCLYCITERINSVSRDLSPERALCRLDIDTNRISCLKDNQVKVNIKFNQFSSTLNPIIKSKDEKLYQEAITYMKRIGYGERELKRKIFMENIKSNLIDLIKKSIPKRIRNKLLILLS